MGLPRLKWLGLGCCALLACQPGRGGGVESTRLALRPTPGSGERPPLFDRGDRIETFDSSDGFFRVHFTRAGRHAVPDNDRDRDGVPDYVNAVASDYAEVLTFYRGLGYRDPLRDGDVPSDNGGDDRFDVYLLDFPTSADGEFRTDSCTSNGCAGYMLLENDFAGRAYASPELGIRLVSSHEFFHAVQHAYVPDASPVLGEGTAVWASEAFDPSSGDLEQQAPGYLQRSDRSLGQDTGGPVDPFTYGSALFFQYLDENIQRSVLRELWERLAKSPASTSWIEALDADLKENYQSSIGEEFSKFAEWNLFTGARADPERGYANGADYPSVAERELEQPYADQAVRIFPLAARYYQLTAQAASPLMAAGDLADDSQVPGIELLIALEHAGRIGELKRSAGERKLAAQLDAAEGDVFHVVLLNTRSDGESLKPDLCIGTPSQVASCRTADGGVEAPAAESKKPGGGCSVLWPSSDAAPAALSLLIAAAVWGRRRLRHDQDSGGASTSAQRKRSWAGVPFLS